MKRAFVSCFLVKDVVVPQGSRVSYCSVIHMHTRMVSTKLVSAISRLNALP